MLMTDNRSPIGIWFLSLPFRCLHMDDLPSQEGEVRITFIDTSQSTRTVLAFSSYLFLVFSPLILLSKIRTNLDS
ncbi:hypothetical protein T11_636 [Trichinella zimbabwensis]|uniref:Uncharacterized protein n=1 Tax=Trichinella zimbabwensis TaxID=268475 RepID=A0A0V1GDC3_9BILA|nr:hypothetical protein T11_636 [Trichinella zimbabwensis]